MDQLSRSTRVQPRVLSAIERNDAVSLPPRPYGRGFVRAYASEVGLDPEGTVRDFFSQFAPVEEALQPTEMPALEPRRVRTANARRWSVPIAVVLGYALVGALVILAGRWIMQTRAETGAVGTTGSAVPSAASANPSPTPAPIPPAAPISIALEAQGPAWVAAYIDGRRDVYRTLQPGERLSLNGTREVSIRTGDAGAVTWQVNGGARAAMGRPGEVRTARVTAADASRMK